MGATRGKIAALISVIALLTLVVASAVMTLILWLVGDWEAYGWGLSLALRIVWGVDLVLLAATVLTWVTIFGWRFRSARRELWPSALVQAASAGNEPPSLWKAPAFSFTVTVVLVSLLGAAVLATALLWILGGLDTGGGWLAFQIVWTVWWLLCIATVLIRIAVFRKSRQLARAARAEEAKQPVPIQPRPE